MKMKTLVAILAALCYAQNPAHAQSAAPAEPSMFSFSGFGTLGAVKTNTDQAQFAAPGQASGANRDATFSIDSLIAAQVTGKFNSSWSAVAQVISKSNAESSYRPELEWAFVKFQATPELSLRAGRIGGPFFMVSDFRNVGYANLWVRPPVDVYSQVPVSHFEGADINYQKSIGDATVTGQLFGGASKAKLPSGDSTISIDMKRLVGVNVTLENGPLTLRFGHVQSRLTVPNTPSLAGLFATLRAIGFAGLANDLDSTDKKATFTGLGASYDQGNFVASGEYTKRKSDSYVTDTTGWYASAGYRVAKFTPYATVSALKVDSPKSTAIPAVGPLAPLAAGVNSLLAGSEQSSRGFGVRYDGFKSIALKAQYERLQPKNGTNGTFVKVIGALPSSVNVFSVSADFVF